MIAPCLRRNKFTLSVLVGVGNTIAGRNRVHARFQGGRASTSGVVIRDARTSKSHAVIEPRRGRWRFRDNGRGTGPREDGERIEEGARVDLANGDLIYDGSPVYFVFAPELAKLLARTSLRYTRS